MTINVLPLRLAILLAVAGTALPARAIPAFARKYGTSCLTCHTAYPKLTPFGEAFRRNGYRFPGVDSDYVKQEQVALGQEANKKTFPKTVWPAALPISVPIAIGANGQAFAYPDKNASVPRASNGTQLALDDLVAEGHLWTGAALDDTITVWGELTLSPDGVDVEHAQLLFNDLLGPKHALNLVVGKGFPTLTSFGPHSSYLADLAMPNAPVTAIYSGSADPFVLVDNYTGLEVNGVVAGRGDWSLGFNTGKNSVGTVFPNESFYGHLGWKIGGMRLDGEGSQGPANAMEPWAETALTIDVFGYRASEHFGIPGAAPGATVAVRDGSSTLGAAVRAQAGSGEVDLGYYAQWHDHGTNDLAKVRAGVAYAEATYVVYPWFIPGIRVEDLMLSPNGGSTVSDLHLMPGAAFLVRPNVKIVLVANVEIGNGYPQDATGAPLGWQGGAADWGSFVLAPTDTATPTTKRSELESIAVFLAWAL
ncbi:MAG TPA: hypothetical protein VF841_06380 [Anaeromyxobacter sp.]